MRACLGDGARMLAPFQVSPAHGTAVGPVRPQPDVRHPASRYVPRRWLRRPPLALRSWLGSIVSSLSCLRSSQPCFTTARPGERVPSRSSPSAAIGRPAWRVRALPSMLPQSSQATSISSSLRMVRVSLSSDLLVKRFFLQVARTTRWSVWAWSPD